MKKLLISLLMTALVALFSCTGAGIPPGLLEDEGEIIPWNGATTSLVVVNDTGNDITFYLGDFNETDEESSDYYCKVALATGQQTVIPDAPCGPELNLWYGREYFPSYIYYSYCTVGGILGKFVLDAAHAYTMEYPTAYSYKLEDETGAAARGDWDVIVTNSRSFGDTESPNQYVRGLRVNVLNSAEWDNISAWLTNHGGTFIDGVTKFHYTGSVTRDFIHIYYRYSDNSGNPLFFDTGFIFQTHTMGCMPEFNNNSFVTADWDIGYENIIENLADHGITMTDIDHIDVIIEGGATTYEDPIGQLSLTGNMTEEGGYFYQTVVNGGACAVQEWFSTIIFRDSAGREVNWDWPGFLQFNGTEWVYNDLFAQGAEGRMRVYKPDLSAFSDSYSISEICISWDPCSAPGGSPATSRSAVTAPRVTAGMTPNERDRALRDYVKAREQEMFRRLDPEKLFCESAASR